MGKNNNNNKNESHERYSEYSSRIHNNTGTSSTKTPEVDKMQGGSNREDRNGDD